MSLIRVLTLKSLEFNLIIRAEHVPGVNNSVCDALSRFQAARFRELVSDADKSPVQVPDHLWKIFNTELNNLCKTVLLITRC